MWLQLSRGSRAAGLGGICSVTFCLFCVSSVSITFSDCLSVRMISVSSWSILLFHVVGLHKTLIIWLGLQIPQSLITNTMFFFWDKFCLEAYASFVYVCSKHKNISWQFFPWPHLGFPCPQQNDALIESVDLFTYENWVLLWEMRTGCKLGFIKHHIYFGFFQNNKIQDGGGVDGNEAMQRYVLQVTERWQFSEVYHRW